MPPWKTPSNTRRSDTLPVVTSGMRRERWFFVALTLVSLGILLAGFRTYLFVCDDAFITFRYASNSMLGHGYVWNAPPFRAVEGYTSFLWLVLLDITWRLTGVEPPHAVLGWSLACALGQLALVIAFARRLAEHTSFRRERLWLATLVVLGTLTNRTFLVWTSSGLETPLFSLFALGFVYVALGRALDAGRLFWLSALATGLALCRPDGVLFVLATLALGLLLARTRALSPWRVIMAGAPLALVAAHFAWRRSFYGFFWPNSYYAKHVAPWPAAGVMYLTSFTVEYALYAFWALVVLAGLQALRSRLPARLVRALVANDVDTLRTALVVLTVIAHVAYYTFVIGGDHFEYRIYAPWIVLIWLSFVHLARQVGWSGRTTVVTLSSTLVFSLAIPWYHYVVTRSVTERGHSFVALAPTVAAEPVHSYLRVFDGLQEYLAARMIGSRHHAHRIFSESYQAGRFPSRTRGERVHGENPVLIQSAVGVPGWVLPHVAILDRLGLNDVVVARLPPVSRDPDARRMGHDRVAPAAYVDCFAPNVRILDGGHITIDARLQPLRDADIVACEGLWWHKVSAR
jgi:arabinofuranosyltransferase